MKKNAAIFADGENLVIRYQGMVKDGWRPRPKVVHRPDEFVWSQQLFHNSDFEIVRLSYYTSAIGDDGYLNQLVTEIQQEYASNPLPREHQREAIRLNPRVFKKMARTTKSRHVDIHMTLDSLRAAYRHDVDLIIFLTGDGDFQPVIEEIMRTGKRVYVSALSGGLSPSLKRCADEFLPLDGDFFYPREST